MISFVWPDTMPYVPWAGGSEVYTIGHLQELQRRNIPTRIIACTDMVAESFKKYPDIPLLTLKNTAELSKLDDTLIFLFEPVKITTRRQAYLILHVPMKGTLHDFTDAFASNGIGNMQPIATSNYMATYWKEAAHLLEKPPVVYPFADEIFSKVERPPRPGSVTRVLFAGRPTVAKGVYTLLASLQMPPLLKASFSLTCVMSINHLGGSDIVNTLFKAHPQINAIPARTDRASMAQLYAEHDVVVMPSSSILWKEAFGMISVEAQRAGCRVVASDDGGLPETDCGGLLLVAPDNPLALAEGISKAIDLGPIDAQQRSKMSKKFTVAQSVDSLLSILEDR